MAFRNNPVLTGIPTGTPVGTVAVPNHTNGDLTALEGGPASTDSNGNETAPVSIYGKDGANVTHGLIADAAVVGDNPGTFSAKLRGLAKIFNDVWDSANHRLHVAVDNTVALGQATMVGSSPVVIASDQSAIKIKPDYLEVAGAGTGVVNGANTDLFAWIDVSGYKWFTVQTTGTWSGTLTVQASGDGSTPIATWGYNTNSGTLLQTITGNNLFVAPVTARWLRVRMTAFTSNTSLVGTLGLFTSPPPAIAMLASQNGTWTMSTQSADLIVFASAAQTTTQTQADQTNTAAVGLRVVLDMTVVGTGSVTLEIDAKDVASGKYVALLTGAAVTTNSTNVYVVHPDLTAVANAIAKDVLPRTWRIKVVANNANSATYSVGASYLV